MPDADNISIVIHLVFLDKKNELKKVSPKRSEETFSILGA